MNSKKGQKAKLREMYFDETGIYPLDNLSRYNHWLENHIVDNIQCCNSDSELLRAFVDFYNNRKLSHEGINYDEIEIFLESISDDA